MKEPANPEALSLAISEILRENNPSYRVSALPSGNLLNRDNALDFLLQGRITANTGTSSIFDAHHDGDNVCAHKNLWSTRLYCTSAFHNKTLIHNPRLKYQVCTNHLI